MNHEPTTSDSALTQCFLSYIGAALAAAPMDPDDADAAQTLAALSAPALPFEADV